MNPGLLKRFPYVIALVLVIIADIAPAHPGGVDENGGHSCHTNCANWGLSKSQYHFHGAPPTASSRSSKGSAGRARGKPIYIAGSTSVIDGDTLEIRGQRIRLHGIDAPESSQRCTRNKEIWRCGSAAANRLSDLIGRQTVTCEQTGIDRYQRMLAICRVGQTEINRWLVANGLAFAYRQYSSDYIPTEQLAQDARIGLWSWEFQYPWEYRRK